MTNNCIDDIEKCKTSFAACRFDSMTNKVHDILVLEGKTDYTFYSRFTNKFHIYYKDPKSDGDCEVTELVFDLFPKGKNIYGIIDPDYNNSDNIEPNIRNRIHVIDANSLETLLVKYSDENHNVANAIANFDKLLRKGKKEILTRGQKNYCKITDEVLKWAFFIGSIRELNAFNKKYRLNFRKTKENSCFYLKYVNENSNYKKEFNREAYLIDLLNESRYKDEIKKCIKEYNEKDVWNICQGHDIIDFIACLKKNFNYSETIVGEIHKDRELGTSVPKWEYKLLNAFDITNFHGSPLQKWFDEINSKVTDCIISR